MRRLLFTLLIALSIGCSPCRNLATSRTDSVHVELRPRTITLHDTILVEIPHIEERVATGGDSSLLSNPYARSEAIIRPNGDLYHTLETIPQEVETRYEKTIEVRDSIVYRNLTELRTIEVERKLSQWQKFQIRGFWILATLLVGALLARRYF